MAHSDGKGRKLALEGLPERVDAEVGWGADKPDFKELDLGSPISPLRTQPATKSASWSSSSSGSGRVGSANAATRRSESHSGELSGSSDGSPTAPGSSRPRPGHARSSSGSLIYSPGGVGNSSATSPVTAANVLPSGNIFRPGRTGKAAATTAATGRSSPRCDVLGSGTGNYGHGSVMRGRAAGESASAPTPAAAATTGNILTAGVEVMRRRAIMSGDPEEVRRVGNEEYKRGNFSEALGLYDKAIAMAPDSAACRTNRAAALIGLGRLVEAAAECEVALRVDPTFGRAHQRLASLYLRFGQVDNARRHLFSSQLPDSAELQKLQTVEKHIRKCVDARKIGDWNSAMREGDAAISAGADSSPQLYALRAEALLKLHQLAEADSALLKIPRHEISSPCEQTKFCGMLCDSYPFFVSAQVEMAMGRFESAVEAAGKAEQFDSRNIEVTMVVNNVRSAARARVRGNDLFNMGKILDACMAYGEGLKFDPYNPVLLCNRAACRYKLGQWEKAVDDCNDALRMLPNYRKALLRRAACNDKLERWADSVRDYEILRKELPRDNEVAEALFHAQVALKKYRGEDVHNLKFGGEVEEISGLEPFKEEVSSPGVFVVYFMLTSNIYCQEISPFVDELCTKYPSVNFLKVNLDKSPSLANAENVRIVPTFKIYKNGARVKEMICPSRHVLEHSVRHYSL